MVNRNVIGYSGPSLALEWGTFREGFAVKTVTLPGHDSPTRWLVPANPDADVVPLTREIDDEVVNRFKGMKSAEDVRRFANRFGFLWLDYPMTFNRTRLWKQDRKIRHRAGALLEMSADTTAEKWLTGQFRIANDVDLILEHAADMRAAVSLASNRVRTPDDAATVAVMVGNVLLDVGSLYAGLDSDDAGTLRQVFRPRSLLGAIWIRFANLIADQAGALHVCVRCANPFVVSTKSRGHARKWCSNACKQAMKRERSKHVDHS